MRKDFICAVAVLALTSCSSDSLVSDSPANTQTPIAFTVGQKNITRADPPSLESTGHFNFGVWAYKVEDTSSQNVMNNYLVGYSDGTNNGYDKTDVSTWAAAAGTEEDHTSPWFYEKLGKKEYTYDGDKFYKASQFEFMSANDYQYLRYWDLAYTKTNFYAYAPYSSTGVSFKDNKLSVDKAANTAGYNDAATHDFIYASAYATNAEKKDVKLTFKHLGAQVLVGFRENVPGYKVELIDVTDANSGIQATPSKRTGTGTYTYTKEDVIYVTSSDVNVDFSTIATPNVTVELSDTTASGANLKFAVPTTGLTNYSKNNTSYNVLPEGTSASYATSSDVYYAVVQPADSETGFTFHVSYKLIAEDNGEEIIVHDARVYVPAEQVRWESNNRYIYSFTITTSSTGTTDPNDQNIDVNSPTVPTDKALCPIVFDGATIEDYTPVTKENGIQLFKLQIMLGDWRTDVRQSLGVFF